VAVAGCAERAEELGPHPGDFNQEPGTCRRSVSAIKNTKYQWVTFTTFRKAVATLIANAYDIRTAEHQLGRASATTTETFYDAGAPNALRVAETLRKFLEDSEPRRT
jgi:integrase